MAIPQIVGFKAEAVDEEGVWCRCTVEEVDNDYVIVTCGLIPETSLLPPTPSLFAACVFNCIYLIYLIYLYPIH